MKVSNSGGNPDKTFRRWELATFRSLNDKSMPSDVTFDFCSKAIKLTKHVRYAFQKLSSYLSIVFHGIVISQS